MKYINYDELRNWDMNDIEDIIDVTDERPEQIPRYQIPAEETDWLSYINDDLIYCPDELRNQVLALYEQVMDVLYRYYEQSGKNLVKYMNHPSHYGYRPGYLFQAIYRLASFHVSKHYQPSINQLSSYDNFLLKQAFYQEERAVILTEIRAYLANLPPASEVLQEFFDLTTYGSERLWWDLDGEFRYKHTLSQTELNIMQSTRERQTKPWSETYKDEIVSLYLKYWQILMDDKLETGPSQSKKRNKFIERFKQRSVHPATEKRHYHFMTALLKVAENTIRQKFKTRLINVTSEEDTIARRFRKSVYTRLMQLNQNILDEAIKNEPKTIRLDKKKISHSQAELTEVVNIIGDFVGDEIVEVDVEESEPKQVTSETEISESHDNNDVETKEANIVYKQFVRQLATETSIDVNEATAYCQKHGMLLNAFINEVNHFLYDYIDDQVLINEGDSIVVDEFYVDDLRELVERNFTTEG